MNCQTSLFQRRQTLSYTNTLSYGSTRPRCLIVIQPQPESMKTYPPPTPACSTPSSPPEVYQQSTNEITPLKSFLNKIPAYSPVNTSAMLTSTRFDLTKTGSQTGSQSQPSSTCSSPDLNYEPINSPEQSFCPVCDEHGSIGMISEMAHKDYMVDNLVKTFSASNIQCNADPLQDIVDPLQDVVIRCYRDNFAVGLRRSQPFNPVDDSWPQQWPPKNM